ncbi:MAG: 4-hydroxy-tetrahydrodipicolinate reductase [Bacteroidales bacterium]|nr:4-hydroxy-tetrahydrodipicolinate reductase [Bacteroidales bacterium]
MNILIIGYGKMGKMTEKIALERNHTIAGILDINDSWDSICKENIDVAIDFTTPNSVMNNIKTCLDKNIPLVVGTTGWYNNIEKVRTMVKEKDGAFLFSPNFSVGVSIFRYLNKYLAKIMNSYPNYTPSITEIHHIHKLDAPSGTAVTLANELLEEYSLKQSWKLGEDVSNSDIQVTSIRQGEEFGTHIVTYSSEEDILEIKHKALSRKGLALGAVVAAEFLQGKKGFFTTNDLMESIIR